MTKEPKLFRMPAEWAEHRATWIAWPHEESDWPGKFETVKWIFAEFVRAIGKGELVEILAADECILADATHCLEQSKVPQEYYRLHLVANDRSWLRDSAPTAVLNQKGKLTWIGWKFNAWAKYDNFSDDQFVSRRISEISERNIYWATRSEEAEKELAGEEPEEALRFVLEGGAIDTDGEGTLLVTEECLLSKVQERNPGFSKIDYERLFKKYLGIEKTIWLSSGIAGDDTHGHIDDLARFVSPGRIVTVLEENVNEINYEATQKNLQTLKSSTDAQGRTLEVIALPMPAPVVFGEERLPASYANFYIANKAVLVPTFGDPQDRVVLNIFSNLFPEREIVGIYCRDFVLGQGTIHCSTQQEPCDIPRD